MYQKDKLSDDGQVGNVNSRILDGETTLTTVCSDHYRMSDPSISFLNPPPQIFSLHLYC